MAKNELVLNDEGIQALLKSKEIQDVLLGEAKKLSNRAGYGYSVDVYTGKTRANASVRSFNNSSKNKNLKDNALLKAGG